MKTIKVDSWTEVPKNYTGIVENINDDKFWYLNGELHRVDGPAIEFANGSKYWYLDGKRHRIDGPAVDWANGYKQYCINGERVTKEAQEVLYAMYKLKGLL